MKPLYVVKILMKDGTCRFVNIGHDGDAYLVRTKKQAKHFEYGVANFISRAFWEMAWDEDKYYLRQTVKLKERASRKEK